MRDQLYRKPVRLRSHTNDSGSFFGALGFTVPVEELTLKMASLANILDWLTQPQGPHLVDGMSTKDPLTALAILITPKALYDPDSPMVGLGFVYKAPYIRAASWSEAYFDLKLASQAEASNQTTGAKIIFVQIQESSQVIPLPGVPTLFLDVKTSEDIIDSKDPNLRKTLEASNSIGSFSQVLVHQSERWPFPISRVKQCVNGPPDRNRC